MSSVTITWADVTAIAPELSTASAGTQAACLAAVVEEIDPDTWGTRANRGAAYLAAHLATLANTQGAGAAFSQRVGPLAEHRAMPHAGLGLSLSLTSYGAEYDRLLHTLETVFGAVP